MILALAAGALALAGSTDFARAGGARGAPAPIVPFPGVFYPPLQPVEEIGANGDDPSRASVYPALTTPDRLLFPAQAAMRSARRWLTTRRGRVAFAVAGKLGGVSGFHPNARFVSASLTKAMILVAFLRRLEATRAQPSASERLSLGYMIRLSDNASAGSIFRRVGDEGMREVARLAGMRDFRIAGDWANATVTPADQARLFLALDRLVPPRFLPLARNLLETVSPLHAWGIPRAARPRFRTFFKGGWRPQGAAQMVHQSALLERGSRRVGMAVLTAEDPTMAYGESTIEGIARRLLGGPDTAPVIAVPSGGESLSDALSRLEGREGFRAPDIPPLEPAGSIGP